MNASVPRSISIPKGVDGEVSKIVQCSAQMADAQLTRNPILALNDAACVVGAVKTWLRKHHASLTMDDLLKMAEVHEQVMRPGTVGPAETGRFTSSEPNMAGTPRE